MVPAVSARRFEYLGQSKEALDPADEANFRYPPELPMQGRVPNVGNVRLRALMAPGTPLSVSR